VNQVRGLERFLARAQLLAVHIARAIADIQPPGVFASEAASWRRFAEQSGATLRVGDMSLHDWSIRGVPLVLDHRWEDETPAESRLWTPRPENAEPDTWKAALGVATGKPVMVEESRIGLSMPTVMDLDAALGVAEQLAAAVTKVRGGGTAGPYR
jgi:hypothetical protein